MANRSTLVALSTESRKRSSTMTPATSSNVEIGIGGDLTGLRGRDRGGNPNDPRQQYRVFEGDFREQFAHLKELIAAYDPQARIQFIEIAPPQDRAEEFSDVAAAAGIPVKQFTGLYVIGGNETAPDALVSLRNNLDLAKRSG